MKIQKLNKKIVFDLIKKINVLNEHEEISSDLFLNLIFYYFLSSKQISFIFQVLNLNPKTTKPNEGFLNQIKNLKEYDSAKFNFIEEKTREEIDYFLDFDLLHITFNSPNMDVMIAREKLNDVLIQLNDIVDFENNENYFSLVKELNNLSDRVIKEIICFFQEKDGSLVEEVYTYLQEETDKNNEEVMKEIYFDLFNFLTMNSSLKVLFNDLNYIPTFMTKIISNLIKQKKEQNPEETLNETLKLINFYDVNIIKEFDEVFQEETKFFVDEHNLSEIEYNLVLFSTFFSQKLFNKVDTIEKSSTPKNIVVNRSFQEPIFEYKEWIDNFKNLNYDSETLPTKMYGGYYQILNTLENLDEGGYGFVFIETSLLNKKGTAKKIKHYLMENNYLDSIITFTSSIVPSWPSKISLVILKNNSNLFVEEDFETKEILMINAILDYKKNKDLRIKFLDEVHINDITKIISQRKDFEKLSKKITVEAIIENDYNLSPEQYILNKNTPKKELSVKKMLEELRKENEQMNTLERKLNNK